jgi:peptide/nickel transport system permease protein
VSGRPEGATLSVAALEVSPPQGWTSASPRSRRFRVGPLTSPLSAFAVLVLSAIVFAAIMASLIAPYDPYAITLEQRLTGPTASHWLGTDELGRDLFSNFLFASRVSLSVGASAAVLGNLLGICLGLLAGTRRGWVDDATMRLMDSLLAIPGLMLALAIVTSFGTSLVSLVIAVGITLIPATTRIVRAATLVEEGKDYILAARTLGATGVHRARQHLLPNIVSPILLQITLGVSIAILIEAFMSFVGLGVQPPAVSLGTMVAQGYGFIGISPWYVTSSGLLIFIIIWTLNVVGDSLRDSLDPRLRNL